MSPEPPSSRRLNAQCAAFTSSIPLSAVFHSSSWSSTTSLTSNRHNTQAFLGQHLRSQRVHVKTEKEDGADYQSGVATRQTIRAGADFYDVLGVNRDANDGDIKSAFRKKARKYHPDVNDSDDAKEKFQEIGRAYEVLSDPQQRARYDQFGEAGVASSAAGGSSGFSDFSGQDFGSFSDIFETFFGGQGQAAGQSQGRSRRRAGPQPGDDLRLDVDIPFEKAVFGGEHKIRFSHLETCGTCDGSGVKPGAKTRVCGTCQGTGTVTQVVRTPLGMFQQTSTCSTCRGTGEVVDEYCGDCGGRGRNQVTKQLMITIPPGVDTGSRLRIRNEGDAGAKGGPPGDLYVMLRVKDSPDFTRDGINLYSKVRVSYLDAILGRSVPVKTVDGTEMIDISAGTQPGAVVRIDKKGIPKLGNSSIRGDHFVTVDVRIPTRLSSDERRLVEELDELAGGGSGGAGYSSSKSNGNGRASATNSSEKGKKSSKRGEGFFNFGKK